MLRSIGRTGWALAIAASMWGAAMAVAGETGVLPPVPEEPVYTASTRVLIESYPLVSVVDADRDGVVSDMDFMLWITDLFDRLETVDTDGDGGWDRADEVASLALLLDKVSGDVNGNGVVNIDDVIEVAGRVLTFREIDVYTPLNEENGDINLDNTADLTDVAIVLFVARRQPVPNASRIASELIAFAESSTIGWRARGHEASISGQYPEGLKDYIPGNHDFDISRSWSETAADDWWRQPSHTTSISDTWPANHRVDASGGWEPAEHDWWISRIWPSSHNVGPSRSWHPDAWPPTGHRGDLSQRRLHLSTTSYSWPAGHEAIASRSHNVDEFRRAHGPLMHESATSAIVPDPDGKPRYMRLQSPHDAAISARWTHDARTSFLRWPTNHEASLSSGWVLPTHDVMLSHQWPSNHVFAASNSWADAKSDIALSWPASHGVGVSDAWEGLWLQRCPVDLSTLWPSDHAIFSTVRQIVHDRRSNALSQAVPGTAQ